MLQQRDWYDGYGDDFGTFADDGFLMPMWEPEPIWSPPTFQPPPPPPPEPAPIYEPPPEPEWFAPVTVDEPPAYEPPWEEPWQPPPVVYYEPEPTPWEPPYAAPVIYYAPEPPPPARPHPAPPPFSPPWEPQPIQRYEPEPEVVYVAPPAFAPVIVYAPEPPPPPSPPAYVPPVIVYEPPAPPPFVPSPPVELAPVVYYAPPPAVRPVELALPASPAAPELYEAPPPAPSAPQTSYRPFPVQPMPQAANSLARAAQAILESLPFGSGVNPITPALNARLESVADTQWGGTRNVPYYWAHPIADPSGLVEWTGSDSGQPVANLTQAQGLAAMVLLAGGDTSWSDDFNPQGTQTDADVGSYGSYIAPVFTPQAPTDQYGKLIGDGIVWSQLPQFTQPEPRPGPYEGFNTPTPPVNLPGVTYLPSGTGIIEEHFGADGWDLPRPQPGRINPMDFTTPIHFTPVPTSFVGGEQPRDPRAYEASDTRPFAPIGLGQVTLDPAAQKNVNANQTTLVLLLVGVLAAVWFLK